MVTAWKKVIYETSIWDLGEEPWRIGHFFRSKGWAISLTRERLPLPEIVYFLKIEHLGICFRGSLDLRLQNSPYFCVFKYARAVTQTNLERC